MLAKSNQIIQRKVITGVDRGIEINNVDWLWIRFCTIFDCFHAIDATGYFNNIFIDNCMIHDNQGVGLRFAFNQDFERMGQNVWIRNTIVKDNGMHGIEAQGNYMRINGCNIHGNGWKGNINYDGILANANYLTIQDNYIYNNYGLGVDMGDCYEIDFSTNRVWSNGNAGIELNSCESFNVHGNRSYNNNTLGLKKKHDSDMIIHKGTGGYPFLGHSKLGTVTNNKVVKLQIHDTVEQVRMDNNQFSFLNGKAV